MNTYFQDREGLFEERKEELRGDIEAFEDKVGFIEHRGKLLSERRYNFF